MKIQEIRLEATRLVFSRLDSLQLIDKTPQAIVKVIDNFAEFISKGKKLP